MCQLPKDSEFPVVGQPHNFFSFTKGIDVAKRNPRTAQGNRSHPSSFFLRAAVGGLPSDDGSLALGPPMVVAKAASGTYHAVAGNEQDHGIAGHGRAHGAHSLWTAHSLSQLAIGGEPAGGHPDERFPHLDLEVGAAQVQPHLALLISHIAWRNALLI